MIKILVANTTNAGTTVQAAQAVSDGMNGADRQVDMRPLEEITGLALYTAVVISAATKFVKKESRCVEPSAGGLLFDGAQFDPMDWATNLRPALLSDNPTERHDASAA